MKPGQNIFTAFPLCAAPLFRQYGGITAKIHLHNFSFGIDE